MHTRSKAPAKWRDFFQAFFYGLSPTKTPRPASSFGFAGLAVSFGFGLAMRLYLAFWVGSWLDKRLNIHPYGVLLMILIALILAFWSLYRRFPFGE